MAGRFVIGGTVGEGDGRDSCGYTVKGLGKRLWFGGVTSLVRTEQITFTGV